MIRLEFDVAMACLLSVAVLLVLGTWFRERFRKEPGSAVERDDVRNMRQCPYCRHMCIDDRHEKIMICPVCQSYFDEESL